MTRPHREQFSGCLVGQCLGDALGAPVEGYPPSLCQRYVEELRAGRAEGLRRGTSTFGQYTDDSQLARELMQSYVACQRFDPAAYAQRIAAIFAEGRIYGPGRATSAAARRLLQGVPWEEAGTPPPAAGNGSAMRAGPIGLLFYDDPQQLIRAAHDQGRITHQDRRCSAGAVAIAGAVALTLRGDPIQAEPFLTQLSAWTEPLEPSVAVALQHLVAWLALPPEQAVVPIAAAGASSNAPVSWHGISPFVTSSVLWSLYAFLRSPDSYWDTVCTAIAVGGDVDTTAAMAGAISGAYLGLAALPTFLARRLTDRGTWGYAELVALAHRCYTVKLQSL
jgi:ADP-ribosylglycohydrolase